MSVIKVARERIKSLIEYGQHPLRVCDSFSCLTRTTDAGLLSALEGQGMGVHLGERGREMKSSKIQRWRLISLTIHEQVSYTEYLVFSCVT